MHVAALTTAKAGSASQTLGYDPSQIDSVHDHGRRRPVIGSDGIAVGEVIEDPGDDPLFADSQVHLTRDAAFLPELRDLLLELPTGEHQPVQTGSIRCHR